MKNLLILLLTVSSVICYGQNFKPLADYKFKNNGDYKTHEPDVLRCCNYILLHADDKEDINLAIARQFVVTWMTGTEDYTFTIGGPISKIGTKNINLMSVYMAAAAKYVLENPDKKNDADAVALNTYKGLIAYVENDKNGVKKNAEYKKLKEAMDKGNLAEYIKN